MVKRRIGERERIPRTKITTLHCDSLLRWRWPSLSTPLKVETVDKDSVTDYVLTVLFTNTLFYYPK